MEDAIDYLRKKSIELDRTVGPNGERGINFVINDSQPAAVAPPFPQLMKTALAKKPRKSRKLLRQQPRRKASAPAKSAS